MDVLHVSFFEHRCEGLTPFLAGRFNRALPSPEPVSLTELRNAFKFFDDGLRKRAVNMLARLLRVLPDFPVLKSITRKGDRVTNPQPCVAKQ